jgi:hypothetical protein
LGLIHYALDCGLGLSIYAVGYRHVENILPDVCPGGACLSPCFDWLWPGESDFASYERQGAFVSYE